MKTLIGLFLIVLLILATPPCIHALPLQPAASFSLGEKADWRMAPLDWIASKDSEGHFDINESQLQVLPGSRISLDGRIVDPLGRQLGMIGDPPGSLRGLDGEIRYVLQDHRQVPGEDLLWLLYSDGTRSWVTRVPLSAGKKLNVRPDALVPIADDHCLRIVEAGRQRVTVVNVEWFRLYRASFPEGAVRPGSACEKVERQIQPWGADLDPDTGRLITLQANGGAVNTVVWLGDDLKPVDTRTFTSGETVELLLEAALPGRRLIFSRYLPNPDEKRLRQYLLLDSAGAMQTIGEAGGHLILRGFCLRGDEGWLLDFQPAGPLPTEVCGRVELKRVDLSLKATGGKTTGGKKGRVIAGLKGLPADAAVAVRRGDGRILALVGTELRGPEGDVELSPGDRNTLAGFLRFSSNYDAFFGEDGLFYIYNPTMKAFFAMEVSGDGRGSRGRFLTLVPRVEPSTREILLVHPLVDAAGDIYLEDPIHFEIHHFAPDGTMRAIYRHLQNLAPGKPGELFVISEVDAASHKVIQEWDGDGNYMRIIRELGSEKDEERISGVHVLGKDSNNQVHLVYFQRDKWQWERIDYVSQKLQSSETLSLDLTGAWAAERPFLLSPDGRILVTRFSPRGATRDFEVVEYR